MNTEPTINFFSSLLLLGGFNGIFFAILLIKLRKRNRTANYYFATILAAIGLLLLDQFLIETNLMYQVPKLMGSTIVVEALFAPCLYLYVRTMTQPRVMGQKSFLHFIPSIIFMIMLLPVYFLDLDQKIAIAHSNYIHWPGTLHYIFPMYMLFMATQFIFYLVLAFKLLFKHTKNIGQFFSYKEKITLAWLRNFLLFNVLTLMFLIYFYTAFSKSDTNIKSVFEWFYVVNVIFVFYLGFMSLNQRRIYKGKYISSKVIENKIEIEEVDRPTTDKYKKSALNNEMSTQILKRLNETMAYDKPYLDSSLTLPQLAKMVATSSNYLSQVINEQLQMKFFDYINSYRIKVAKELLINPLPHTSTILDIAMESAFNSKSAFYSAFKKQVGITPAEFKKHILNSQM